MPKSCMFRLILTTMFAAGVGFNQNTHAAVFSVSGTVYQDVSPLKSLVYVSGARIILERAASIAEIPTPYAAAKEGAGSLLPVDYLWVRVDSATSSQSGAYTFAARAEGLYRLSAMRDDYQTKSQIADVSKDTYVSFWLLPADAGNTVSGNVVAAGAHTVIAACTVEVWFPAGSTFPEAEEIAVPYTGESGDMLYRRVFSNFQGIYTAGKVPITYSNQPVRIVARAAGFLPGETIVRLLPGSTERRVDLALEPVGGNVGSITHNKVEYSVVTSRKNYAPHDSIRVRYRIKNTGTATVRFGGVGKDSPCTYYMTASTSTVQNLYEWPPQPLACITIYTEWEVKPGDSLVYDFPAFVVDTAESLDNARLTISAGMPGYPNSTASVQIIANNQNGITSPNPGTVSPGVRTTMKPAQMMSLPGGHHELHLDLDKEQIVNVLVYDLRGRLIPSMSLNRILSAGNHVLTFAGEMAAGMVRVVRVKADEKTSIFRIVGE